MDFQLQIATPDGLIYSGSVKRVVTRTTGGDVGILARHSDYVASLDIGKTEILFSDGSKRTGSTNRGMISMINGVCRIVAITFEWADEIDIARAEKAAEKAQARLRDKKTDSELRLAEYKLKRALNRIRVYNEK